MGAFRNGLVGVLLLVFVAADYLMWDLFDASSSVRNVYIILAHLVRSCIFGFAVFAARQARFGALGVKVVVSYAAILFIISLYSGVPGRIPGLNIIPFNMVWFWNDPLCIDKSLKGAMLIFYFVVLCCYGALLKNEQKCGVR